MYYIYTRSPQKMKKIYIYIYNTYTDTSIHVYVNIIVIVIDTAIDICAQMSYLIANWSPIGCEVQQGLA